MTISGTDIVYKVIDEGLINSEILRTFDGYFVKHWPLLICVTCCIICSVRYQYTGWLNRLVDWGKDILRNPNHMLLVLKKNSLKVQGDSFEQPKLRV